VLPPPAHACTGGRSAPQQRKDLHSAVRPSSGPSAAGARAGGGGAAPGSGAAPSGGGRAGAGEAAAGVVVRVRALLGRPGALRALLGSKAAGVRRAAYVLVTHVCLRRAHRPGQHRVAGCRAPKCCCVVGEKRWVL